MNAMRANYYFLLSSFVMALNECHDKKRTEKKYTVTTFENKITKSENKWITIK